MANRYIVVGTRITTEWTGELHQVGPYDGFVYAYGGFSEDALSRPLRERGLVVEVIGDAFAPRSLQHAILEGHQYAREQG